MEIRARQLETRDFHAVKALWKICFDDSEGFIDWFFRNRYIPDFSACAELDGKLISAMQSIPLSIRIRGKCVPGAMIAGVSTDPAHRGIGAMSVMFRYFMKAMRNKGIVVTPHTPAVLPTFFSKGHLPVTDTAYLTLRCPQSAPDAAGPRLTLLPEARLASLYTVYQTFSRRYSGIVARSFGDFCFKMQDYLSDGMSIVCADSPDQPYPEAYAAVKHSDSEVYCEECVALDAGAEHRLLMAAANDFPGNILRIKLPPDTAIDTLLRKEGVPEGFRLERRPQGVMGLANAGALLQILFSDLPQSETGLMIRITDSCVTENEGCYTICGVRSEAAPHISIPAGLLVQLLCGYRSLSALRTAHPDLIAVSDEGAACALSALTPGHQCYIIDEY